MKIMKKSYVSLFALLLISHFAIAQWGGSALKGSGNVQTENRSVGSFDQIVVSSGIDLYITQGSSTGVKVEADDNIIPIIKTEVKGNTLKVYSEKGWRNAKKVRVNVTMPSIQGISASGGSDVYSVGSLKADNLSLKGSGGSDLNLNLQVEHLDCSVSGGSDAELEGAAAEIHMTASGGSDIEAYGLKAKTCTVSASGGSDAYVNVTEKIDLSASGGSDIHHKGGAEVGRKSVSGSSDVHRQ